MNKKTILIMTIALVLLFGNILDAKPRAQRNKMMRHAGFGLNMAERNMFPVRQLLIMKAEIGLTDVQVKKIEKIQLDFQHFMVKSNADSRLIEIQIQSEFNATKVNRSKVASLVKKVGALKTDMQVNRINHLLDVKSVLTKAQIDKINALRLERRGNRSNRMMRGQRGRGVRSTGQNMRGKRF